MARSVRVQPGIRNHTVGRSQDGILGGCGIHVSTQLVHLPGTSGVPQTPKGTGRNPQQLGRTWGLGGVKEEK